MSLENIHLAQPPGRLGAREGPRRPRGEGNEPHGRGRGWRAGKGVFALQDLPRGMQMPYLGRIVQGPEVAHLVRRRRFEVVALPNMAPT